MDFAAVKFRPTGSRVREYKRLDITRPRLHRYDFTQMSGIWEQWAELERNAEYTIGVKESVRHVKRIAAGGGGEMRKNRGRNHSS
jgi:hypothetical protein